MKYIWFYNVCTLIVKQFIPTKIEVAHHFDTDDWVYFEYTVANVQTIFLDNNNNNKIIQDSLITPSAFIARTTLV